MRFKILKIWELWSNMGTRYLLFRAKHLLLSKTGLFARRFPNAYPFITTPSLEDWRTTAKPFFFESKESLKFPKQPSLALSELATGILEGNITFFSHEVLSLGTDYDWVTHPITGYRYDIHQHWTRVNDFSPEAGDIKYVWEKSRFSYLLPVIRYDYHFEKDCSEWVFQELERWIVANPLNHGPNYKCSQEISIRILNWTFILYYYRNSNALTPKRFSKILQSMYGQIKHVRANIDFSRIAVRNNHAITETMTLYLMGFLFPFFPEAEEWKQKGLKWLEEEVSYQIYDDGTFLQFSHNYQRVTVQLLTWATHLSRANGLRLSEQFYKKAQKTIEYLYQCQDAHTGALPNYGANDGALFFQLSDATYRDFRPQLQALYQALTGASLYEMHAGEDYRWYQSYECDLAYPLSFEPSRATVSHFPQGGIVVVRDQDDSITFLKCAAYKDRPSQADNLHLDIWYQGENVLPDAGTYLYNTTEAEVRYFFGTEGHNTLMLGSLDQMQKGPRFIWWNWIKKANLQVNETEHELVLTGTFEGYKSLGKGIIHTRTVTKQKGVPKWIVKDHLNNPHGKSLRQLWHLIQPSEAQLTLESDGAMRSEVGYYAACYGQKQQIPQLEFVSEQSEITTHITISK